MTKDQKEDVITMRKKGCSYGEIAKMLGISRNTVKTFCTRKGIKVGMDDQPVDETPGFKKCVNCGRPVLQTPGRKEKRFCNDTCRTKWWNSHLHLVKRKAFYNFICPACGKPFTAYGARDRKYCSQNCYIATRYGGKNETESKGV